MSDPAPRQFTVEDAARIYELGPWQRRLLVLWLAHPEKPIRCQPPPRNYGRAEHDALRYGRDEPSRPDTGDTGDGETGATP